MQNQPFYRRCICIKIVGGKKPLWHALIPGIVDMRFIGAGNTADNAIRDLQQQLKATMKDPSPNASKR